MQGVQVFPSPFLFGPDTASDPCLAFALKCFFCSLLSHWIVLTLLLSPLHQLASISERSSLEPPLLSYQCAFTSHKPLPTFHIKQFGKRRPLQRSGNTAKHNTGNCTRQARRIGLAFDPCNFTVVSKNTQPHASHSPRWLHLSPFCNVLWTTLLLWDSAPLLLLYCNFNRKKTPHKFSLSIVDWFDSVSLVLQLLADGCSGQSKKWHQHKENGLALTY